MVVPNYRWTKGEEHTYYHYVPYNLCCLAAMTENMCHTEIIDAYFQNMDESQFAESLQASDPDIVGITVIMDQFSSTGHLAAQIVKTLKPKVKVIMGGVYATMNPEYAIRDGNIDYYHSENRRRWQTPA